jgi:TPR repeat protein
MEQGFIDILKKVAKEQGKETFLELKKCKATVSDYTKADYRIEKGLLLRAVEQGVSNALFSAETADIDRCMKAQQHVLCEEQFMDNAIAWNIVFILAYVLRDITIKEIKTEGGSSDFDNAMGFFYAEQYDKAVPIFETLAGQGHAGAEHRLGMCYGKGLGVTVDRAKAFELYQKAADKGNANAQYNLAGYYQMGRVVAQDYSKAAELLRKAADHGFAKAQNDLGYFYEIGQGVPQDYAKAAEWYKKAAAQEDFTAKDNLDKLKKAGKI